jgi:hypothetical protein
MDMELVKSLIWDWRYIATCIIAVILFAIFDWQNFKVKAYSYMLLAKSMAKDAVLKSGQEQEDFVVKQLMIWLPVRLKALPGVNEENIRKVVHFLYVKAKDLIDNGKLDNSVQ